jgi:hypothetical protein
VTYANLDDILGVSIPFGDAIKLSTVDEAEKQRFERDQRNAQTNISASSQTSVKPLEIVKQPEFLAKVVCGDFKRLFVTGEGGTGKTEYTRLISLRMAEAFLGPEAASTALVPYRVELRNIGETEVTSPDELFNRVIRESNRSWVKALANRGRLAFVLDGLDELSVAVASFFSCLSEFVNADFPRAPFIFSGRPGSLKASVNQLHVHEIQPLTYTDIRDFARAFFARVSKSVPSQADASSAKFIAQLRANQSTLDPLIFTPFIVSFALTLANRGETIPGNPAELIDKGLRELFATRRTKKSLSLANDDYCLEALSILAAHMQVPDWTPAMAQGKPLPGPAMSCPRTAGVNWLRQFWSQLQPFVDADTAAFTPDKLIDHLAPGTGLLFQTETAEHRANLGTMLTFTNRVLTEFLAARWIARHGYPNWPYRHRRYVQPTGVVDDRERSLYDFFGDLAWSIKLRDLIWAVCFELSRPAVDQADSYQKERFGRNVDLLINCAYWFHHSARPLNCAEPESVDARQTLVSRVSRFLEALPDNLHVDALVRVVSLVNSIVPEGSNWTREPFWRAWICRLPPAFRGAYFKPLLAAVSQAMTHASEDEEEVRPQDLLDDLGSAYGGLSECREFVKQVLEGEMTSSKEISLIATVIANWFSDDGNLMQSVRDALTNTMLEASDEPSEITSLRRIDLVPLIARFFADDSPLMSAAESFLQSELSRTPDRLGNQLACVRAVAAYFPGNPSLRSSAVCVLQDMLAKESIAPSDAWWGTQLLVHTAATEFTYDAPLRESAREILANTLKRASQDSRKTWFAICFSAESVAACFAEDEPLKRSARDALVGMLAKKAMKPRQNWGAVGSFTRALGSCFADDLELKRLALDALKNALLGTATDYKFAKLVARSVSRALASGFTPTIDIAAFLVGNGQAQHLCIEEWREWVTLHGVEHLLRQSFLACWNLPNGPAVIRVLDEIVDPDHLNRPRRALIFAPREGIRRGLPAVVLHEILADYFHNSDDLALLSTMLRDFGTAPGKHAANWLDALRYLEETDSPSEFDRATAKKKVTLQQLRSKLTTVAKDTNRLSASVEFPFSNEGEIPSLEQIKHANTALTDTHSLTGKRLGPKSVERIRLLSDNLNMARVKSGD